MNTTSFINIIFCILVSQQLMTRSNFPSLARRLIYLQFLIPLFIVLFLFDPEYMSDQLRYLSHVKALRENFFIWPEDFTVSNSVISFPSFLMALIPIPFIESTSDLGLANRLLFVFLLVYLYKQKFLPSYGLYILILYPSLLLYTSLALRETLIIFFMILSYYLYTQNKFFSGIASFIFIINLKFQNAIFIVTLPIIDFFYSLGKIQKLFFIFFCILSSFLIYQYTVLVPHLDEYRYYFFWHDGGNIENYISINNFTSLVREFFFGFFDFLVKPLPSSISNNFQLAQLIENIIVIIVLAALFIKSYLIDKRASIKWLIFFILSIGTYGLVVYNFGTSARYRTPIIVLTLIGLLNILNTPSSYAQSSKENTHYQ